MPDIEIYMEIYRAISDYSWDIFVCYGIDDAYSTVCLEFEELDIL